MHWIKKNSFLYREQKGIGYGYGAVFSVTSSPINVQSILSGTNLLRATSDGTRRQTLKR